MKRFDETIETRKTSQRATEIEKAKIIVEEMEEMKMALEPSR